MGYRYEYHTWEIRAYDHSTAIGALKPKILFVRYEQLWDDNIRLIPKLQKYVNIYATVTERARRAALQITFGLRTYLGRDVARMIGKMVYATRFTEDWELN